MGTRPDLTLPPHQRWGVTRLEVTYRSSNKAERLTSICLELGWPSSLHEACSHPACSRCLETSPKGEGDTRKDRALCRGLKSIFSGLWKSAGANAFPLACLGHCGSSLTAPFASGLPVPLQTLRWALGQGGHHAYAAARAITHRSTSMHEQSPCLQQNTGKSSQQPQSALLGLGERSLGAEVGGFCSRTVVRIFSALK